MDFAPESSSRLLIPPLLPPSLTGFPNSVTFWLCLSDSLNFLSIYFSLTSFSESSAFSVGRTVPRNMFARPARSPGQWSRMKSATLICRKRRRFGKLRTAGKSISARKTADGSSLKKKRTERPLSIRMARDPEIRIFPPVLLPADFHVLD